MSINVYEAYRVKRGVKLFPFLRVVQEIAKENAIKSLKNTYLNLMKEVDTEKEGYKEILDSYRKMYSDKE